MKDPENFVFYPIVAQPVSPPEENFPGPNMSHYHPSPNADNNLGPVVAGSTTNGPRIASYGQLGGTRKKIRKRINFLFGNRWGLLNRFIRC